MMNKVSIPMLCIKFVLFNSFKATWIMTSWGGYTLAGLAIRMRMEQTKMYVSHCLERNVVLIILLQSDRKKSKAEVMAELIAKSKEHKVTY
jgi:hypothetical protein